MSEVPLYREAHVLELVTTSIRFMSTGRAQAVMMVLICHVNNEGRAGCREVGWGSAWGLREEGERLPPSRDSLSNPAPPDLLLHPRTQCSVRRESKLF